MTTLQMPRLSAPQQAELERTFFELANRWRDETALLSSVTRTAMHPAYQRIIGMGPAAVPLILRELEQRPDHWFWALTAITGEGCQRLRARADGDPLHASLPAVPG